MEVKHSFSNFIKNEILKYNWTEEHLFILFCSFLRTNGVFKKDKFIFKTTLLSQEEKINLLFETFFNLKLNPIKTKTSLKYEISNKELILDIQEKIDNLKINNLENIKAFISGSFLGKGWTNSPSSKFYHFEIRVKDLKYSLDLQEAFHSCGIETKTIIKNNWYQTYVKKSTLISDILSLMNASESVMIFADVRIERDFVSTLTKISAVEPYNKKKTLDSSEKQIKAFKKIKSNIDGFDLSEDKLNLMNLRLENPSYSLDDLQMKFNLLYQKNVSRSTINFWLKKIVNLVEEVY